MLLGWGWRLERGESVWVMRMNSGCQGKLFLQEWIGMLLSMQYSGQLVVSGYLLCRNGMIHGQSLSKICNSISEVSVGIHFEWVTLSIISTPLILSGLCEHLPNMIFFQPKGLWSWAMSLGPEGTKAILHMLGEKCHNQLIVDWWLLFPGLHGHLGHINCC